MIPDKIYIGKEESPLSVQGKKAAQLKDEPLRYVDNQNYAPTPSMKKEIAHAATAVCTLGMSEIAVAGAGYLKKLPGSAILKASQSGGQLDAESRMKAVKDFEKKKHPNESQKLEVITGDGAKLDGQMIRPLRQPNSTADQKYVIWLNGFGQSYEAKLNDAVQYANKSDATILMYNYRGTGDSTGSLNSAKDLVKDTVAMVNLLRDTQGAKDENITIHGYSLGGGIGAQAAAQLEKVQFISDRSFTSLSKATKEVVAAETRDQVGGFASKALGSIAGSVIKHSSFELNTKKLYENRDNDNENVESLAQRSLILYHPKDNAISPKASLATSDSVKDQTKAKLSGRIVDLGNKEQYRQKLKNLGDIVADAEKYADFAARMKIEDSDITDERIDIIYRSELIRRIKVNLIKLGKNSDMYPKLSAELKGLENMELSEEPPHSQFVLDSPVAVKVLDFVRSDQRFPQAPTFDLSDDDIILK